MTDGNDVAPESQLSDGDVLHLLSAILIVTERNLDIAERNFQLIKQHDERISQLEAAIDD